MDSAAFGLKTSQLPYPRVPALVFPYVECANLFPMRALSCSSGLRVTMRGGQKHAATGSPGKGHKR